MAGGNGSAFLMRGAEELPEHRAPRLLDRLQQARSLGWTLPRSAS